MGKRSAGEFERVPNDLYRTWDTRAVAPLLPHLLPGTRFVEPCAGHGDLIDQLERAGHECVAGFDIAPQRPGIRVGDATRLRWPGRPEGSLFITNPPWTRHLLHGILRHLPRVGPLWALFDGDWLHSQQAADFQPSLRKVVAVGRVRWIEGSGQDGKDNCAWYLFDATRPPSPAELFLRR